MVLRSTVALALLAGACMARSPRVRLNEPKPIAVAYLVDGDTGPATGAPDVLRRRVSEVLAQRNLEPQTAHLAHDLAEVRDTSRRLDLLAAGEAPFVMLVELRASFFSALSGRYRWTVHARLSVAERNARSAATKVELELPAVLDFEHEREGEALASVAGVIAQRVGMLLDTFLAGRAGASRAARDIGPIYFILVDRFANGDPRNDGLTDPTDPSAWHGGDLKGIAAHLDHLAGLGVRTLWLSPLAKSRQEPFFGHGAFHGYWVEDHRALEPRFGDWEDLRMLTGAARARGMHLMLDMVLNHVGPDAPLAKSEPMWFHRRGPIANWDDPRELVDHDVRGLPDLAQERQEVAAYLIDASQLWLTRAQPAGLRLDAVRHVPLSFWARYTAAMRAHAGPELLLLGEVYDGNPGVLAQAQREGGFTHLFDFPLYFALKDVFCDDAPLTRLAAVLSADASYADPSRLVTFLDNHDLPRILSACHGEVSRVLAALTAQLTARGVPALTYGTEMGLQGDAEPLNRADMRFQTTPVSAEITRHLRALLHARHQEPVLAHGDTRVLMVERDFLVMLRRSAAAGALVALNRGSAPRQVTLSDALAGSVRDALTGRDLDPSALSVPPHAALVANLAAAPPAKTSQREVHWRVFGLGARTQVVVAGLGPSLGHWRPEAGVVLSAQGPTHEGSSTLPASAVYELKLATRDAGATRWETRPNRYLFVPEGEHPLLVELVWNQPEPT